MEIILNEIRIAISFHASMQHSRVVSDICKYAGHQIKWCYSAHVRISRANQATIVIFQIADKC